MLLLKQWYKILYVIGAVIMFRSDDIYISEEVTRPMILAFGLGLLLIASSFDFKAYYADEKKYAIISKVLLILGIVISSIFSIIIMAKLI